MRVALSSPPTTNELPRPRTHADPPLAWQYEKRRRGPRLPVIFAVVISAGAHAMALFGFNDKPAPKVVHHEEDMTIELMEMPNLEDLDEPELVDASDGPREEVDAASYVPMLADVPTASIDATFVQKVDFSSLAPRPDFDATKVVTIPAGQRTGGVRPDSMSNIFNLKDLDRIPEPVFQPPPVFPRTLKNEVSKATVTVEFIVDPTGKVTYAKVIDASYPGFEDAAIVGVMRWQFRPGMKGGKRVATRMIVPLIFRVVDE